MSSHFTQDRLLRLERVYDGLRKSLAGIGYVFPGSVVERLIPCGKSACRCAGDDTRRHGPYYEWTRKLAGKTVTVRLTVEQARLYQEWIGNRRKLKKILGRMQAVSMQVARTQAATAPRR